MVFSYKKTPFFCSFFVIIMLGANPCNPTKTKSPNQTTAVLPLKACNPAVLVGTPIEIDFPNPAYHDIIRTEFSTAQALWYARWRGGWSAPNTYHFATLDSNINFMVQHNISPVVHMLFGQDTYMPDWLIHGKYSDQNLDTMMLQLVQAIMLSNNNYQKVDVWNVHNELFNDDGSYRTNMVWNNMGWEDDASTLSGIEKINTKHPVFIAKALRYCRQKTTKKLEIRDFNIENNDPEHDNDRRHKAMYQLIRHLQNTGAPIDAIGIQGHLHAGHINWLIDNNALTTAVAHFKSLGIEVHITEMDARLGKKKWSDTSALQQKEDLYNYMHQAIKGGANRINLWGIQDGMDKGWITDEHPLLWDEQFRKKPAYYGVQQALLDSK